MDHRLVFKGGTCLNKCYLGYYRLSEDLDFVHADSGIKNRSGRKNDFRDVEDIFDKIISELPEMKNVSAKKYDEHQQMRIDIRYDSLFIDEALIKIEITHRYPLSLEPQRQSVSHQFRHPVTKEPYTDSADLLLR